MKCNRPRSSGWPWAVQRSASLQISTLHRVGCTELSYGDESGLALSPIVSTQTKPRDCAAMLRIRQRLRFAATATQRRALAPGVPSSERASSSVEPDLSAADSRAWNVCPASPAPALHTDPCTLSSMTCFLSSGGAASCAASPALSQAALSCHSPGTFIYVYI